MAQNLSTDQLRRLARLGAQARLEELRREESAIRAAFPDLFSGAGTRGRKGAKSPGAAARKRRLARPKMSAANRKAVSERMRKYWAERRKAKGEKK